MKKKVYKLGILGGGLTSIAGYPHFAAARMDGRFEIESGVFSRNRDAHTATAEYWNIKRHYDTIDSFIANEKGKIDAVSVLLPTPDHFETIRKLIRSGIPVICEKPLCYNTTEIRQLDEECDPLKTFLVATYNYIAYPILAEVRRMTLDGHFGKVLQCHLEMPQESFLNPPKSIDYPPAWRKKDGAIPSILLDLLTHLFSILHFVSGEKVTKLFAQFSCFSKFHVVDDVKITVNFRSGAAGFFWVSKTALGNRNGLRFSLYGDKVSATWCQESPERLILNQKNGDTRILQRGSLPALSCVKLYNRMTPGHPSGYVEALANLYCKIADALDDFFMGKDYKRDALIWGLEKEKENFNFMSAAVKSARQGVPVRVN